MIVAQGGAAQPSLVQRGRVVSILRELQHPQCSLHALPINYDVNPRVGMVSRPWYEFFDAQFEAS